MGRKLENWLSLQGFSLEPLLLVLWFGTLWGAIEATAGGFLHLILPPTFPGRMLIALAMGLMGYAAAKYASPWLPLGMACVAAALKLFSAVVYQLPVSAPAVLNPAFGILAEGVAFSIAYAAVDKLRFSRPLKYGVLGAGAGALQVVTFVAFVRTLGLAVFPARDFLYEIGTKFPSWVLTQAGIMGFLSNSLPGMVVASALGVFIAGILPIGEPKSTRKGLLVPGISICLAIFFLSSWLM